MKKVRVTFYLSMLLMLSGSFLGMAQYSGDTWESVKSNGSGSISLAYVETPGFVYKDAGGKLTGICVDIMDDFVSYINSKYQVSLTTKYVGDGASFGGMYNKVKESEGGVVGLGNITIRETRKKEVKFSPPFITNFAILVTQSQVPTLNSIKNINQTFKGLTAYAPKGTTNEKRLEDIKSKYYPGMVIKYATSSPETLNQVLADKNGFAYLDLAFYLDAIQKRKPIKRHPIGDQSSEQFGFIMPMNSDWQPLMNEFFNSGGGYTNTMPYKKILAKHLGDTGVKLLQTAKQ
ncbi:amino acid ABC transporter substrate-binding protein [Fulvivirga sp. M361]|uniref:substrate-binding periplasmic protein n=1 Tax=Fulvivirga sp. M361 TaxID=2594266 RepID=UPI00117AAEAC|nr:transporter substrate-binding domain-containing protein [Fulvivirga sp. M361]TRX55951.1 amino acid ABC transporter substrate-binding protein [Fulvivirga sp. M361]